MTTMFLLAHQDDEMGVFGSLRACEKNNEKVVCVFATNGNWGGCDPAVRNRESQKVLTRCGVRSQDTYFLGTEFGISDGSLPRRAPALYNALATLIQTQHPRRLVMPAWEGGHQDHDALHWLGVCLAHRHGLMAESRQFSLYRASGIRLVPYRVMSPLAANGQIEIIPLDLASCFKHAANCLSYKTQRRPMLGLVPFMLLDQIISRCERLQPVSMQRLAERPHDGPLLYELRGRYAYDDLRRGMSSIPVDAASKD